MCTMDCASCSPSPLQPDPWVSQAKDPCACCRRGSSPSWALSGHYFISPPAPRPAGLRSTERFRWVCTSCESQWGAALCRCLPGPCCESSKSCSASTYFPLETVLTAHLACLSVLRLYLGCCRVLQYKERTLRRWT